MIVPRNLPVHYCAFCAIQKVHFILNSCFAIMLISLGPQNERYNEVAVYIMHTKYSLHSELDMMMMMMMMQYFDMLYFCVENIRGKMQKLWESVACDEATVAQMILYPNPAALSKLEIPEVLSLLPDIEKKDILELGAGIGYIHIAYFLHL